MVAPTPIGNDPALRGYDPPYGLAATGPGSFVVGLMTPSDCSTQFFRFRLNGQGRPGALTPVGPTLPGDLSVDRRQRGRRAHRLRDRPRRLPERPRLGSYLGVFDPAPARPGSGRMCPLFMSQLSMSADGRLLAFTQ